MKKVGKERKEKQKKITKYIQVEDMKLLHTTDWLMCACRADIVNMTVVFVSGNRLLYKHIQGHSMLLIVRTAVTYRYNCARMHVILPTIQSKYMLTDSQQL